MAFNLHAVASSALLAFKSDWENPSFMALVFMARVLCCGSIVLSCIWIIGDLLVYRDRLFRIGLTASGLLLPLVVGLRKHEPPVAVLSQGLNEAE